MVWQPTTDQGGTWNSFPMLPRPHRVQTSLWDLYHAIVRIANTTYEPCSVNNVQPMYVSYFSAERYDPLTSTWTSIAAMSTRRRYVRVATLGTDFLSNAMWCLCFAAHVQTSNKWGNYQPYSYWTANIYFSDCLLCFFIARWQPVCSGRLWQLLTSRNGGKIWPAGKQVSRLGRRQRNCSAARFN